MSNSLFRFDHFSDEILLIILKNLDNDQVLYSLMGVNQRLNRFVHDSLFTNNLTLMNRSVMNFVSPLSERVLHRFSSQILPEIHHRIKWLSIESSSMERILSFVYPNLNGLGLYNLQIETMTHLFTHDNLFTDLMKNQIESLIISIRENRNETSIKEKNTNLFTDLLMMFTNLKSFKFDSSSIDDQYISFDISPPLISSSKLLELHVNVPTLNDCLYLLDGRFDQLRVFYVHISWIGFSSRLTSHRTESLPNLKCFSLHCGTETYAYNELILPLLHRMFNLEKVDLYLVISCKNIFLNGNHLKENLLTHLTKLNQLTFNIRSSIRLDNQMNILSNEDIQSTFKNFSNNRILSSVDYFSQMKQGQCHIYSYPYQWKEYHQITNRFPGIISKYVRQISLFDEQSFEHDFFLQISKSFPLMRKLTLINEKAQKKKNHHLSITEYPHLSYLNLTDAHDDYIEEFFHQINTSLPDHLHLSVDYQRFKRVTQHFTSNTTRNNCQKLRSLALIGKDRIPKYVKEYFPQTKFL